MLDKPLEPGSPEDVLYRKFSKLGTLSHATLTNVYNSLYGATPDTLQHMEGIYCQLKAGFDRLNASIAARKTAA